MEGIALVPISMELEALGRRRLKVSPYALIWSMGALQITDHKMQYVGLGF